MIPHKIQPYFNIKFQKEKGDNTLIKGMLECCNSCRFEVHVCGELKKSLLYKMYLVPDDDKMSLVVCCKQCGKVISVFDSNYDGYDGCRKKCDIHLTTRPLACKKCMDNNFSVSINYEYTNVNEIKDIETIEPDDAYSWIWVTLECNKCGTIYYNFIDFETA